MCYLFKNLPIIQFKLHDPFHIQSFISFNLYNHFRYQCNLKYRQSLVNASNCQRSRHGNNINFHQKVTVDGHAFLYINPKLTRNVCKVMFDQTFQIVRLQRRSFCACSCSYTQDFFYKQIKLCINHRNNIRGSCPVRNLVTFYLEHTPPQIKLTKCYPIFDLPKRMHPSYPAYMPVLFTK